MRLELRENVAFLTFARPNAANTIHLAFGHEFLASVFAIESSSGIRAVVITGEGKHFCLGGDLRAMATADMDMQAYLSELTTNLHAGMALLARVNAPVIAAVNGTAAGAGLGLVLAADIVIAGRSAKFVPAYTGVALTPDAGCTFMLPRVIGYKRAMELFLTNRMLSADEALAWGLVNDVVDDENVATKAAELATHLAAGPVGAFGALKRLMLESEPGLEAQQGRESRSIAARGATAEGREGITAFIEKRPPRYP
jgi:2-(1,2-epoxy-1,2-dihydrophenyl)acetyl-CoA isomerase